MPIYIHHNKEVILPDIVGKKYSEARDILKSKGFKIIVEEKKSDDIVPPDIVLIQNPRPNSVVRKGRRVYVTLSTIANTAVVPSLIGNSEREAEIKINNSGLNIGLIERDFSSFYPEGVVINQSPLSGTKARKGELVNITVSLGKFPDEIIVPDIEGKNLEIAKDEIRKAGLKIGKIYHIVKNDLLPNTILGMGFNNEPISSGTPLKPGDSLDIIVSEIDTSLVNADSAIF
ncbi:MAG: PASTA domain-containing protein [Candidatus Helarchaeota archaeon]|nr:PASTA domain-containing protein [Candidatus Helarchaeota archaeon]